MSETKQYLDLHGLQLYDEIVKRRIADAIGSVSEFNVEVVSELPVTGASHTIYFVPTDSNTGSTTGSSTHYEYMWIENDWELIGSTEIDLSDYYTVEETNYLLDQKQDLLEGGYGIVISGNVISVESTGVTSDEKVIQSTGDTDAGFPILVSASQDPNGTAQEALYDAGFKINPSKHSIMEGNSVRAFGEYSHAEGIVTTAYGIAAHAEGSQTTASGYAAHVEGSYSEAYYTASHAEGLGSVASSNTAHAEGSGTTASWTAAHAEGLRTSAENEAAHAEGCDTVAEGPHSHAGGTGTKAACVSMTAIGRYNATSGSAGNYQTLFVIGNGADSAHTSDAMVVKSDGTVNATNFISTSDARKKNIKRELDLEKCYELIDKCSEVVFEWKDKENSREQIGMIAQEVQEFFPEIVFEDGNGYLSLDYTKLSVICLRVLKDLINEVKELKNNK